MKRAAEGRGERMRAAAVVAPIGLVVLLAAVLAWRAWDAGRAHRELARRTVSDYADFAAAIVASGAEAEISQALFYAFRPLELAERRDEAAPVSTAELAGNEQEARRCSVDDGPVPRADKWYARLELASGELDVAGALDWGRGPALARALRRVAEGVGEEATHGHLFLRSEGLEGPVAYRIRRTDEGDPVAVHATASCFRSRTGPVFTAALREAAVLPPGLVGEAPADSLLTAVVRTPGGGTVYRSPASYASEFTGGHAAPALGPLGGVEIGVTLREDVGRALVAGGIPPSPLPLALGLLLLAVLLAGGTVLQLQRAVELVRTRERFVADVSHELRTPLQQILLYVQLLRMDRAGDEAERREALRVAERETLRLIRLVDRVLSFVRSGRTGDDGAPGGGDEPVDVAAVLEESVGSFRRVAARDGTDVRLAVEENGLSVRGDADDVRRMVVNVLENAVRYGPEEQTVRVGLRRVDGRARIVVEDQGPGIPAKDRERVWEPFRRLEEGDGGDSAGTGIGLAIVRELVEEAGGEAWIEDAEAGGARVVVELPLAEGREA